MKRILVVDPLQLRFSARLGGNGSSTGDWFRQAFGGLEDLEVTVVGAEGPQLCGKALEFDGVVLGGSDRSACEDSAYNDGLLDLIAICRNGDIPFLGICFGAQLLARALGGLVAPNPKGLEIGSIELNVNEEGKEHFLFSNLEESPLRVLETHRDAIVQLPDICSVIASTDQTEVQAFDFDGSLFGVQFHPEMDGDALRDLWDYWERAGDVAPLSDDAREAIDSCTFSRCLRLLENFANHVDARSSRVRS